MESVNNLLMLIFVTVTSIGIGVGFDIKKPSSWLYVLCGFLIGPLLVNMTGDLILGIKVGVFVALITIWCGSISFKRRQQFKK